MELMAQLDLDAWKWAMALGVAVLVGFAKTGIGGIGIVVVPLMAMIFPPTKSPGILLPMLVMADICAVGYYHKHAVREHLLRPLPWAVAGVLIAFFVLKLWTPSDASYGRLIGGIVLLCLGVKLWKQPGAYVAGDEPRRLHPALIIGIGLLAGFSTMTANAAGPIWVIYLLAVGLPKYELVATGAWFFMILNVFKLPFQAMLGNITWATLGFNVMMLPAIAAGALIGVWTLRRINQNVFNQFVQWLAAAAAVKLIFS